MLVDALEEEGVNDQDYYIDAATIDVIADGKATEHLVGLLRAAVGIERRRRHPLAAPVNVQEETAERAWFDRLTMSALAGFFELPRR